MSTYWRPQEEHLLKTLLPTNSHQEIAEQLTRRYEKDLPGFPVARSADAVRRKCERENWTPENIDEVQVIHADTYWQKVADIVEEHQTECQVRRPGVMDADQATRKILILSDIHFPFARTDFIMEILDAHADADIVVLNGDIIEGYAFMSFQKERHIAAIDEYNAAMNFVRVLASRFPKVILIEGNHDVRAARYLGQQGVGRDAFSFLRPNFLSRIANGEILDRTGMVVEKINLPNVYFDPAESWFAKVGKTIIFHPSTWGAGDPGKTVTTMGPKLGRRYEDLEVDSYVCGHTHKIYKGVINGKLYIEQGCLAGLMQYFFKPTNDSMKHYQNGYCVLYQDEDGNTDFNRSGPIYLGECIPPKKDIVA